MVFSPHLHHVAGAAQMPLSRPDLGHPLGLEKGERNPAEHIRRRIYIQWHAGRRRLRAAGAKWD